MTLPPKNRRHPDDLPRALWFAALAVAIFAESSCKMPKVQTLELIPHFDKAIHVLLFGALATLAARIPWIQWRRPLGVYSAIFLASFFGATDEWHQHFTPGRGLDFWDWVADTSGAALAVVLYANWHAYRALLERPIFTRRKRRVEIVPASGVTPADGHRRGPDEDRRPALAGRAP